MWVNAAQRVIPPTGTTRQSTTSRVAVRTTEQQKKRICSVPTTPTASFLLERSSLYFYSCLAPALDTQHPSPRHLRHTRTATFRGDLSSSFEVFGEQFCVSRYIQWVPVLLYIPLQVCQGSDRAPAIAAIVVYS